MPRDVDLTARPATSLLVAMMVLFAVYLVWAPPDPARIVIPDQAIEDLVARQAQVQGRPPTDTQRRELASAYVEEQVLFREALRLGLDRGDPRVREALLGAMFFELADVEPGGVAPPSDDSLRRYFERNVDRYRSPEYVTIDLLSFPVAALSPEAGRRVLRQLESGEGPEPFAAAEAALSRLDRITLAHFSNAYGREVGAPAFRGRQGAWQGPLESPQSTDFVRIITRQRPPMPRFEGVRSRVQTDWIRARYDQAASGALDTLRRRYRVVLPPASQ